MSNEVDYRVRMINALLVNPHADRKGTKKDSPEAKQKRDQMLAFHQELLKQDPIFYGKLGYWYLTNGDIRDHKEMFIGNMFISEVGEHRDAAYAVTAAGEVFAPFQVARLISLVEKDLNKNMPRSMKTAVAKWFDNLQSNHVRFDGAVLNARHPLKFIARRLRLRPTEYADNILFKNEYPEGSVFSKLKEMSTTEM